MNKIIIFLLVFSFWMKEVYWLEHISYDNIKWINKPPKALYIGLKNECLRQKVPNAKKCIKVWLSIAYAESSFKNLYTPYWLQSKDKDHKGWVKRFKKYWFKANNWEFFYWKNGKTWKSKYCLSEKSSWTVWRCKNWEKNFSKIFNNIKI